MLLSAVTTLVACSRAPDSSSSSTSTCPACPTCAPPAGAPPAASSAAAPRALPASEDEDLYCRRDRPPETGRWNPRYGAWVPTPAEVRAAIEVPRAFCAPKGWLAETVSLCMQRLGQTNIVVRYGVMDGDRVTPTSCDITVRTAEWRGRKWVALNHDIREGSTFLGYVTAVELTPRGPVVSTEGCQLYQGQISGAFPPREPPGWKTFPEDLKSALCL